MNYPAEPNEKPLKLLFVKLKHIGDALLLTPTLEAVRHNYPNAEIWVVVRRGTEGILEGCTSINKLLTATQAESARRKISDTWKDLRLSIQLREQRFDYAFDLTDGDRGRWMVGLSRANKRGASSTKGSYSKWWGLFLDHFSPPWGGGHRVEKDYQLTSELISLNGDIPNLSFSESASAMPSAMRDLNDYVIIHPGSRWKKKRWPLKHWLKLGENLLQTSNNLIVSCGPEDGERKFARTLVSELNSRRVVNSDGRWSWAELAGCLRRSRAYVGIDTAATHLAAACQCPIVAMYSYTIVDQWKPWRSDCTLLHPMQWLGSRAEVLSTPPEEIMEAHTPQKVMAAVMERIRPPYRY